MSMESKSKTQTKKIKEKFVVLTFSSNHISELSWLLSIRTATSIGVILSTKARSPPCLEHRFSWTQWAVEIKENILLPQKETMHSGTWLAFRVCIIDFICSTIFSISCSMYSACSYLIPSISNDYKTLLHNLQSLSI